MTSEELLRDQLAKAISMVRDQDAREQMIRKEYGDQMELMKTQVDETIAKFTSAAQDLGQTARRYAWLRRHEVRVPEERIQHSGSALDEAIDAACDREKSQGEQHVGNGSA